MFEIIVAVLVIVAVVVIVVLFKSGGQEVQPKLSLRERNSLEKGIEEEAVEIKKEEESPKETAVPIMVTSAPQRDPKLEIMRFKTFFDIENDRLTKAVRNGIEKCNHSEFKGAIGEFSSAIEMKSENPIGHYCRALTKLRLRNYESSIPDFTEAIRLQMGEANALYYRGVARYNTKDYNGAELDLMSYLKAEPNFAEGYYMLGLIHKDSNKLNIAIENFSMAINKNARHEAAFFERALAKNKTGDNAGCCIDLKKAYELGHLEAYHYLKQLCKKKT
jgi:tetratricopeptide (TPR) repeat protein